MIKKYIAILLICLILPFLTGLKKSYDNQCNEFYLTTADNMKIAVNHYKKGHKEVLIIAPGWFMTKDSFAFKKMSQDFSKYYDVISFDFRGHCKSSGTFTFTSKESLDMKAVVDYAHKYYDKVYLAGFSLGAATSVIYTAQYKNISKVILVSAPVSFDKIENKMWKKEAFIPTIQKFEFDRWVGIRPGKFWLSKTAPIEVIDKISPIPVLIITGDNDPTVCYWHSKTLYNKASEPKKILIFQNSYHAEDIYLQNKDKFISTIVNWIND